MKSSLYKQAFLKSHLILFLLDQQGKVIDWNQSFEDCFLSKNVSQEFSIFDFSAETISLKSMKQAMLDSIAGAAKVFRGLMHKSDGSSFWAEIGLSQLIVYENTKFIMGSIVDVTSRELISEMQEEDSKRLETLACELKNLNESKNYFLGMAAHDLRTPLHKISFIADMLVNSDLSDKKRTELCQIILRSSEAMSMLINDLLDITKVEAGKVELHYSNIILANYIQEIGKEFQILSKQKNLELTIDTDLADQEVAIDTDRMRQVLGNLLSNALKFSPIDGQISVRAFVEGVVAVVEILDSGPGISKSEQGKLFKPFQQLSNKALGGETGTGLGLAICKKLVQLHQGEIGMRSVEGGGSLFWIKFPIHGHVTI